MFVLGCADGKFECEAGGCILDKDVCDGWDDCPYGSDETAFLCTGNDFDQTCLCFIFEWFA